MSYFLKTSKQGKRIYLAIYESFYSPEVKGTRHKCIQSLGSVEKLMENGLEDPIGFYRKEVAKMNNQRKEEAAMEEGAKKLISDKSPERRLGYFPVARILNNLDVKEHFDLMQSTRSFTFSLYEAFSALVYSRIVEPCSKLRTFEEVIPSLYMDCSCSYDQLLSTIEFIGSEYEKFTEILTEATSENYGLDTSSTYFDCTNFYFEIDRETDFQKRGPSKENRTSPIVGLGLLLDSNMIPIGMRMYPGNESEKPVLRNIIGDLKKRNNIKGKTVRVCDKGLNCAQNIADARKNGDGYLFSKSVRQLPEAEKKWVLLDEGYTDVYDSDGSLRYRYKSCVDEYTYSYRNDRGERVVFKTREKRVVTYNPLLAKKKNQEITKMVNKARSMSCSEARRHEYGDSAKYIKFTDGNGHKAKAELNEKAIEKDRRLAGYNMLITSEVKMESDRIYETYHNLWRIEESFKVMKSQLDARPVFLQTEDRIKGHFFICYAAVLLVRLLQFKELKGEFSTETIMKFMKDFRVVQISSNKYVNLTTKTPFIKALSDFTGYPLMNYYFTERQIKMMHYR